MVALFVLNLFTVQTGYKLSSASISIPPVGTSQDCLGFRESDGKNASPFPSPYGFTISDHLTFSFPSPLVSTGARLYRIHKLSCRWIFRSSPNSQFVYKIFLGICFTWVFMPRNLKDPLYLYATSITLSFRTVMSLPHPTQRTCNPGVKIARGCRGRRTKPACIKFLSSLFMRMAKIL